MLDLLCSNYAPLNYSGQESKINLQFIILTHLWPHHTGYKFVDSKQGYSHVKFERHPLNNVCQKANIKKFLSNQNTLIISLEYMKKWKNSGIFIIHLIYFTILQISNLTGKNIKFSIGTVQHCCDPEMWTGRA